MAVTFCIVCPGHGQELDELSSRKDTAILRSFGQFSIKVPSELHINRKEFQPKSKRKLISFVHKRLNCSKQNVHLAKQKVRYNIFCKA